MKALLYFTLCFVLFGSLQAQDKQLLSVLLQEAEENYSKGIQAKNLQERESAFNRALRLYIEIEDETKPTFGNGKLYYNIGNTFFQLQEYPTAALYYYRAKKLRPNDSRVQNNLEQTLQQLSLPIVKEPTIFEQLFSFHYRISLPVRLQLLFLLTLFLLLVGSVYIWRSHLKGMKYLIGTLLIVWTVLLGSVIHSRYFSPIEAVVIHSVLLSKDAGEQYAKVSEEPVPAGTNVKVLDIVQEGAWLKILTPQGQVGYISHTTAQII